jgi:uncharacterized SAM-dependent methyltransferase
VKYFKNTELAKIYKVSEKSVRNWIQAAQDGRLGLDLHKEKSKYYIANTSKNTEIIENQVTKGKKYKNSRGVRRLTPKPEFYEVYTYKQILDILSNLSVRHESPLQYGYVNGGAVEWDEYVNRLSGQAAPNILNQTISLLELGEEYLDTLLSGKKTINIVDLGPGNGLPVKPLIEKLKKQGRLGRYIAIDISSTMLDILEANIKQWFGGSIHFESHLRDITYERFTDLLADDLVDGDTANLVLCVGGTLANFRQPNQILQVINGSLGPSDLFIYTGYLDTEKNRRYFDLYTSEEQKVPAQDGLILGFLNVAPSLYDVSQKYDDKESARLISVLPKFDLIVEVQLENGKRYIEQPNGKPGLLWRHRHFTLPQLIKAFADNDFEVMHASKSKDGEYVALVSKVKEFHE